MTISNGTKLALAAIGAFAIVPAVFGQSAPFGNQEDLDFAEQLWGVMEEQGLAGVEADNAIRGFPYEGSEPHGLVLDTLYSNAELEGRSGALIVKRNYGPEGVSVDDVQANAAEHLNSITVMFKREEGYDSENANWFWAKYLTDGTLDKNPAGVQLAGRVAKGMDAGCIACHNGAGEDMVFTSDHIQ